jgi:nucleoside-diphosphate-sugar epimerase
LSLLLRFSLIIAAATMATTILITGASGLLGTSLVTRPAAAAYRIRAMSRRERPPDPGIEWVVANLSAGNDFFEQTPEPERQR